MDTNLIALYKALGGGWEKEGLAPEAGKERQIIAPGKISYPYRAALPAAFSLSACEFQAKQW